MGMVSLLLDLYDLFKGYRFSFLQLRLSVQQFLKLGIECLAHSTVSHVLVALDTILKHCDFYRIIFSHNFFSSFFVFRLSENGFTSFLFLFNSANIQKVQEKYVL